MGVKLDWDIEAEKGKKKEHREDSQQRGARYRGVFRLFLTVAVFVSILGGIIYLVKQRLEQYNQQMERLLVDTVQAEVTALRLGDLTAFQALQRSDGNEPWLAAQNAIFTDYQSLKVNSNVVLSGRVLDSEVDGQHGWVQVEEIIDGVPYVQTWFYWNYSPVPGCNDSEEDCRTGWLHGPIDTTLWNTEHTIARDLYTIEYADIDSLTATQLDQSLQGWFDDACTYIECSNLPPITVDIRSAPGAQVYEESPLLFVLPSPYTGRARADIPFDTVPRIEMASLLADHLVDSTTGNLEPVFASDASYLRDSLRAWMVGRFVQLNPETHLMQSLVDTYGIESVSALLRNLQATSSMSILATVTGNASVADMSLDWRDYIFWRLELEDQLISSANESVWVSLYDFTDPAVQDSAYQRYRNNFVVSNRTVLSATLETTTSTLPQLVARVNVTRGFESGEEIIVFNLINGNWLRAN